MGDGAEAVSIPLREDDGPIGLGGLPREQRDARGKGRAADLQGQRSVSGERLSGLTWTHKGFSWTPGNV